MRVERQPNGDIAFMYRCDVCSREFRLGQHRWAGRPIPEWDILICEGCEKMNHDGLVPHMHRALMRRLDEKGVKLEFLPGGYVRIPPSTH